MIFLIFDFEYLKNKINEMLVKQLDTKEAKFQNQIKHFCNFFYV